MEERASGIDRLLLPKLKALARRGAALRREPDGAGAVEHPRKLSPGTPRAPVGMSPQELSMALEAGWLTPSGTERFVLSRRGLSALRAALNRPAGAAATAARPAARAAPARPGLNARESPLAWLRQRQGKDGQSLITSAQFEAGERLRVDFDLARMMPRVTASWNAAAPSRRQPRGVPGTGFEMSDTVVAARQRVTAALNAVGPELSGVLIDVCCFLKGLEQAERERAWSRRSGKIVLQIALAALARHYGLERGGGSSGAPAAIRHWGADGYRPAIDGGAPAQPHAAS